MPLLYINWSAGFGYWWNTRCFLPLLCQSFPITMLRQSLNTTQSLDGIRRPNLSAFCERKDIICAGQMSVLTFLNFWESCFGISEVESHTSDISSITTRIHCIQSYLWLWSAVDWYRLPILRKSKANTLFLFKKNPQHATFPMKVICTTQLKDYSTSQLQPCRTLHLKWGMSGKGGGGKRRWGGGSIGYWFWKRYNVWQWQQKRRGW